MRKIHIRFKHRENFSIKRHKGHDDVMILVGSGENSGGQNQVILRNPKLRRTIFGEVYILDYWHNVDKWFTDQESSVRPLWSKR